MNDQIFSINELLSKAGVLPKTKKPDNNSGESFSKILENAVSKPELIKNPQPRQVSDIFQPSFINPLNKIESNQDFAKILETGLNEMLSDLEIFSKLLGNSSIDMEDIKPLADKIQENSQEILRMSQKNNIPDELKSIARESTALAYTVFEKLNKLN
ncbi:MAG: hypothetical protein RBR53_02485 [Desulforegulaceae bacterium]|nr:hypothetical protein [Desulforegulaceae bacterium]